MSRLWWVLWLTFSSFFAKASVTLPVTPAPAYSGSLQEQGPAAQWQQQQRQFYLDALLAPAAATLAPAALLRQEDRGSYNAELWQIPLSSISHTKAIVLEPKKSANQSRGVIAA